MGQLVSGTQRSNTMFTRVLVLLLPTLSLSQVTLFRQASHEGPLSSHHAHEVHDLTSSHTRHHTSTPGGLRVFSQAPALVSHAVQRAPSLVQHRDGSFFALNSNIQPGQIIQSGDGRYFTLASSSVAPQFTLPVSSPVASSPIASSAESEDSPVIEVARDVVEETTTITEPPTTTTTAPATASPREAPAPEARGVISSTPLNSATSRFVSALPLFPQLTRIAHPVAHIAHSAPVLPQSRLVPQINGVPQPLANVAHSAPVFTQARLVPRFTNVAHPVNHVHHPVHHAVPHPVNHVIQSTPVLSQARLVPQINGVAQRVSHVAHSSPVLTQSRLLPLEPPVTAAQHSLGFRVISPQATQAVPVTRVQEPQQQLHLVREVPAVAQEHQVHLVHDLPPVVAVGRNHELADSRSNVFQGFFEFPAAGLNFDF